MLFRSFSIHTEVLHVLDAVDAEHAAPGIVAELEATLTLIDSQIGTEVAALTDVTTHLFTGASKLIRPIFLLLSAAAGEVTVGWADSARTMAAVIEIAHVATLYHDDVMDEATSRRGLPSANVRFGNNYAVIAGDLLLSRALEMACETRAHVPYNIVLVDADEGFRMMAHGENDLAIGDKVTASYRPFAGRLVPYFEKI